MPFFWSRSNTSAFTDEEIRTAPPERKAWILRVLDLAQTTGASIELARQAVEEADRSTPQNRDS